MKGNVHPANEITINPSGNESILDIISRTGVSRRHFVRSGIHAATLAAVGGVTMRGILQTVEAAPIPDSTFKGFGGIGFESVPPSLAPVADAVAVPPGYSVEVLAAWGDPIMPGAPEWSEDATQDAIAQAEQFGMHNDGMHFFPLGWRGRPSSRRGMLCVNHEYTHEEILHGAEGLVGASGVTIPEGAQISGGTRSLGAGHRETARPVEGQPMVAPCATDHRQHAHACVRTGCRARTPQIEEVRYLPQRLCGGRRE
jgi:secreted PhoX family phosphatase